MKRYQGNTVLMELIIVILFFSLSMVIVMPIFSGAQERTSESRLINHALNMAQNAAEALSAVDDTEKALTDLGFVKQEDEYQLTSDRGYTLTAVFHKLSQPAGALTQMTIVADKGEKTLFTIPVSRYVSKEGE